MNERTDVRLCQHLGKCNCTDLAFTEFVNESLCTLRGEVGHSWQRKQVR